MSAFGDILGGIETVLKNGVAGIQTYGYPVDDVRGAYPVAVILPTEPMDPEIAFAGNSFEITLRITMLVASADSGEGFLQLWDYLDPTQANRSVIRALRANPTLNGTVDSSRVDRVENIGRRELGGGFQFGFDVLLDLVRSDISGITLEDASGILVLEG